MNISVKKAVSLIRKKHPSLTVKSGVDYNDSYYVFEAVENPNEIDYNSPYYAVHKRTGVVSSFYPLENIDEFINAYKNRRLQI